MGLGSLNSRVRQMALRVANSADQTRGIPVCSKGHLLWSSVEILALGRLSFRESHSSLLPSKGRLVPRSVLAGSVLFDTGLKYSMGRN